MSPTLLEFRKSDLVCVPRSATIERAFGLSVQRAVHHLPVLADTTLVGVLCTCDMRAAPLDAEVGEFMRVPITLSLGHSQGDAVDLMNECGVGSIVLLDGETPCGIVTRGDLARSSSEELARQVPRCACCGATSHLKMNSYGKSLCVECRSQPRGVPSFLTPFRDFAPSF